MQNLQTGGRNRQFNAKVINYREGAGETSFDKIKKWLAAPDPWLNHDAARRKHEPGTGQWLLTSTEYKAWKSSSNSMLWLSGNAGCGKTILCSLAIEDMCADVEDELAFFYFSFSDSAKQTLHGFVSSILHQLAHRASVQTGLRQAYNKHYPNKAPTSTLEQILSDALAKAQTTLIMDAMDEVPKSDNVRRVVMEWMHQATKNDSPTRILFTSRPAADIEASVADLHGSKIALQAEQSDLDVQAFVDAEIARHHRLCRLDELIKEEILLTLRKKTKGVFRWAFCVLDALGRLASLRPQDVRSTLNSFPSTLNETYERMLQEIPKPSLREACDALRWLVLTPSPMTTFELCQACVIDLENQSANLDNQISQEDLFAVLGPLITVDQHAHLADEQSPTIIDAPLVKIEKWLPARRFLPTVRLAHSSVREYLLSDYLRESPQSHFAMQSDADEQLLAQSCLLYLKECSQQYSDADNVPQLNTYVARTGVVSFVKASAPAHQHDFLSCDTTRTFWQKIHNAALGSGSTGRFRFAGNALYCSTALGWLSCTEMLLRNGADPRQRMTDYPYTPLLAACYHSHITSMRLLLEWGADPNVLPNRRHGGALNHACLHQDANAVKLLLKYSANPNLRIRFDVSPLYWACCRGNLHLVEILLDAGADVTEARSSFPPFDRAVEEGHLIVAQILLDRAAGSKAGRLLISTANIETVIRNSNLEMLSLLVRNNIAGHPIAISRKQISTDVLMLVAAVSSYQTELVKTLLVLYKDQAITRHGRDRLLRLACGHADMADIYELQNIMHEITATDEQTRTHIVNLTASCKRVRLISTLLNSTAFVYAAGGVHGSALRIACLSREERLVSIMLGAHKHSSTVLTDAFLLAAKMGELEIVRHLVNAGVDVDAHLDWQRTALQQACLYKQVHVIRFLVDSGAQTAPRNGGVRSADEIAQRQGFRSVHDLLDKNNEAGSLTDVLAST